MIRGLTVYGNPKNKEIISSKNKMLRILENDPIEYFIGIDYASEKSQEDSILVYSEFNDGVILNFVDFVILD